MNTAEQLTPRAESLMGKRCKFGTVTGLHADALIYEAGPEPFTDGICPPCAGEWRKLSQRTLARPNAGAAA